MSETPSPIDYATPGTADRKRGPWRMLFGWALFVLLVVTLFALMQSKPQNQKVISLSEFDTALKDGSIQSLTILTDEIVGTMTARSNLRGQAIGSFRTAIPVSNGVDWGFVRYILENRGNAIVYVENNQSLVMQVLVPLIPWFLIFAFIWFFVFRHLKRTPQLLRT